MIRICINTLALLVAAFLFSTVLSAQQATVTVKVEKDGKLVKDTTYRFDDAEMADHAVKVMEVMSGLEEQMMGYDVESGDHPHGKHVMVIKSDDGEETKILVDEDEDCGHKKKVKVVVSGDEETEIEKIIEEERDGEDVEVIVVKKKVAKDKSKKQ